MPNLVVVSRNAEDVVRSLNKSEKQKGKEYSIDEGVRVVGRFLRPIGQYAADYPNARITFNEITKSTSQAIDKLRKLS